MSDTTEFLLDFEEVVNVGGGGTSDFNQLQNRPKYNGQQMTGGTNIPKVPTKTSDLTNDSGYQTGTEVASAVAGEAGARELADNNLQSQIDAISASSDVTDIVGTYAELEAYDTTKLKDNDIIKVLQDESQNDETTYYRWSTSTEEFTLIGEEGPYYTKAATDTLLGGKQNTLTAGANITIDANNEISATDTTYSDFTGTDGTSAGAAGLVPAPATTDAGKFLKADGTWDMAGGGSVFTKLTSADYDYPTNNPTSIAAWKLDAGLYYFDSNIYVNLSTGNNTHYGGFMVVSGETTDTRRLIWVSEADSGNKDRWMLYVTNATNGSLIEFYQTLFRGDVVNNLTSVSTTLPLSARQGKALKDLIDGLVISGAGAPTTSTVGTVGKLYEDTTNGKLYQCTAVSGSTYTWTEVGAGGGGPTVVQTTGTSQTDVMSQNAITSMVFADPAAKRRVQIGDGASALGNQTICIGYGSFSSSNSSNDCIAIGTSAHVDGTKSGSIALGASAGQNINANGMMDIGSGFTSYGYNNTNYRLLTGLHDPVNAHDAATKGYVDSLIGNCRELTSADYNYDSDGDTVNDTVALWLLDPGVYWWEFTFADNGGIKFNKDTSAQIGNSLLINYSNQVTISYMSDATSQFRVIRAFNRSILGVNNTYGWAPYVPFVVNNTTGAVVNFQTDAIPVGRGDLTS